jgi:hypothetical protein
MMTRPSSDQLLAIIRTELPNLSNLGEPDRAELLGLIGGLLATVEQRARHEATWMLEESEQIDQLAEFLITHRHRPRAQRPRSGAPRPTADHCVAGRSLVERGAVADALAPYWPAGR